MRPGRSRRLRWPAAVFLMGATQLLLACGEDVGRHAREQCVVLLAARMRALAALEEYERRMWPEAHVGQLERRLDAHWVRLSLVLDDARTEWERVCLRQHAAGRS